MTGLSAKPSECEVTISLNEMIKWNIKEPGVAGVYTAAGGSYKLGRPVLHHIRGRFTLYVGCTLDGYTCDGGCWEVTSVVGGIGDVYLRSSTAPSLCPADSRMKRKEWKTHWRYMKKGGAMIDAREFSVKCKSHLS